MANVFQPTNVYIPRGKSESSSIKQVLYIEGNGSRYFAEAPVFGIKIDQQVDFNLSKTLKGNFNLTVFEDLPVVITITGMQALYSTCNGSTGDISRLYKEDKAGKVGSLRLTIKNAMYDGVVVSFSQQTMSDFPGAATYSLTLFGVRVR